MGNVSAGIRCERQPESKTIGCAFRMTNRRSESTTHGQSTRITRCTGRNDAVSAIDLQGTSAPAGWHLNLCHDGMSLRRGSPASSARTDRVRDALDASSSTMPKIVSSQPAQTRAPFNCTPRPHRLRRERQQISTRTGWAMFPHHGIRPEKRLHPSPIRCAHGHLHLRLPGSQISQTDQRGKVTTYEYDRARKVDKTHRRFGNEFTSEYDENGNLLRKIDPTGNRLSEHL